MEKKSRKKPAAGETDGFVLVNLRVPKNVLKTYNYAAELSGIPVEVIINSIIALELAIQYNKKV